MVQIFNKLDLEGNFFNLRMATFERPVAYTGDSVFPLSLGSRKRCQLLNGTSRCGKRRKKREGQRQRQMRDREKEKLFYK